MRNRKAVIYCETVAKGRQAYYLRVEREDYFLFIQDYRKSNRAYFGAGVRLEDALDYSSSHSTSVRRTMAKLIPHIRYVEQEYRLAVLNKTVKAKGRDKKAPAYNRQKFKTDLDRLNVA